MTAPINHLAFASYAKKEESEFVRLCKVLDEDSRQFVNFDQDIAMRCDSLDLNYSVVLDNLKKSGAIDKAREILMRAIDEQYHIQRTLSEVIA